jgi:hypothetical protein
MVFHAELEMCSGEQFKRSGLEGKQPTSLETRGNRSKCLILGRNIFCGNRKEICS